MSAVTVELMSIPHYEHAGTIARVAVNRDGTEVRVVVPIARRLQANSFSTVCGEPRLNGEPPRTATGALQFEK